MKPRHFIPAMLLFLLVVYPLSIGPVARIIGAKNDRQFPDVLLNLYSPVIWLLGHWPKIEAVEVEYVDWWLPDNPELYR
jgi:hypothetical protein